MTNSNDIVVLGMLNDSIPRCESTDKPIYYNQKEPGLFYYFLLPMFIVNFGLAIGFVISCLNR